MNEVLFNGFLPFALVLAGMIILIKGADWLVEGSTSLARRFGMSDLMIGLTIVSFGTSAPELIVNIFASLRGSADIAIGNIVGSNISNTFLILGVTAAIAPLTIVRSTVMKEIPFNMLGAFLLLAMANDALVDMYPVSELSRSDGLAFLGFFAIFIYYTFGLRVSSAPEHRTEPHKPLWLALGMVTVGLVGLAIGGELTVRGAKSIAQLFGMSEALIGLTVVAIGTSLPELVTSVVAAMKGKADIAVGNIVGSNIFNIFWILGISAFIKPLPFQPVFNFDLSVSLASALLLFFLTHNGHIHHRLLLWWKQNDGYRLSRWEGVVLVLCYVGYIVYIGLRG